MKKLILSVIFGFVVVPAVIGGTFYSLDQNGFFNLDNINITIGEELSPLPEEAKLEEERLKSFANYFAPLKAEISEEIMRYKSMSLWELNLEMIARNISSREWIDQVYLSRRWPSQIEVRIIPKQIKLLYMEKTGKLLPIVANGEFLSAVNAKQAPDVALLNGEMFFQNKVMRKKAVDVISQVPHQGKFSAKTISELRYDKKEGFWMTLIQSGIKVKVGEEGIPLKAARVSQVLEYMNDRQLDARVIDANLSKKVLVRLRKDP